MNQKVVVGVSALGILLLLVGGTGYKVYQIHQERNYMVIEKRIVEGALSCVYDGKCNDQDMTLDMLISKGYASDEIDPKTKLYYKRDSLIKKVNDTFVFEGH